MSNQKMATQGSKGQGIGTIKDAFVTEPSMHSISQDSKGKEPMRNALDYKSANYGPSKKVDSDHEAFPLYREPGTPKTEYMRHFEPDHVWQQRQKPYPVEDRSRLPSIKDCLSISWRSERGIKESNNDSSWMRQSAPSLPAQPALEDFISQIKQVYPQIGSSLILRFAQEQLYRYGSLSIADTLHSRSVANNECLSESYCFKKANRADSYFSAEVSTTDFPPGIPLPPVTGLPARFECPICFEVKFIQNPFDWISHVHDDLQPYVCIFPDCIGPHVFKQASQWMEHEKYSHRRSGSIPNRLTCNVDKCNAVFYRLDLFHEHLRRMHGIEAQSLDLVDKMGHDTWTLQTESCIFCGEKSATEKTHLFHLSKHMEQISYWSIPLNLLSHHESTPPFRKDQLEAGNSSSNQAIHAAEFLEPAEIELIHDDTKGWARTGESGMEDPHSNQKASLVGIETLIDSGYGSYAQRKPTQQNTSLDQETCSHRESQDAGAALENIEPVAGNDTEGSVYSSTSSLSDASMNAYIFAIAEDIANAVGGSLFSEVIVNKVCNALPRLLKGLASSIGNNATSQMHLDVMVFLRKYRRNITASCREILAERPSWKSSDDSENMSLAEKMNRWQGLGDRTVERADYPASEWLHIDSADISTHEDDEDSSPEPNFPGVQAYKSLVKSDPSYGKLISDVFRECMVMSTLPDSLEEISSAISRILPASPRVSRKIPPERFIMMFKVDWDPVAFLQEQQYLEPPEFAIGQAIVLTGSTAMVQTLTCSEYLQQTWPSSGVSILKLIQELVKPNHHPERSICILPDETQVKVGIEASNDGTKTSIVVLVNALPSWIIEIGEVLSWMGSALKTSPQSDRLVFCKPSVVNARRGPSVGLILSDFTCTIHFTTHMAPGDSQLNGQCWHGLFKNPVVAEGFPIARRPSLKIGLEIPLAMMAILAGTSHAHTFGKSFFLKGFSTMLVPTESDGSFVLWHLISSKDGSRISYNDGVELGNGKTQLLDLQSSRHILGWCSTMKFLVGSRDARYSVETSGLPKASPTCLLANVTISQGHNVAGATGNISFGLKDFKSGGRRRNYIQKLKSIEKRFVLLWDEGHKRGWLVNGATALLHLVRASLEEDRNGVFSAATIFHPARMRYPEPYRPYSASWVLGDKSNARIPIYDDDNDPVLFHEYVTQFYEILEKAFDYQTAAVSANPERCTSRSRLEGWDFENLAAERDPIFAKEATLDCAGMAWIDLIRSVHAITLFGRGFGDMIQPIGTCSNWDQVPAGNSYLVICQEDLKEIVASWCGNLSASPPMLTDQIIWHIPENTAIKCRCISTKYMRHSDIAQVLLPSTMAYKVTGKTLNCEDNKGGAFIFGLNSMNLWHWPEAGEPSRKPIVLIDGIRNDCETSETLDSGMGGSCDSRSSTREDSFNRRSIELRTEPSLTAFSMTSYSISDNFTIGIICALHIELMAVRILFDTSHDNVMVPPTDTNSYAFGSMGQHNVVATCLPDGEYGTNSAASVASNMRRTFNRLQFCLLVGIGGGVPSARNDIRLGDVVVSKPIGSGVGVLPYDMIKAHEYGSELNGYLQPPPRILRSVSSLMKSDPRLSRAPLGPYLRQISDANPEYAYPDAFTDILYESGYTHPRGEETCEKCDTSRELLRPPRTSDRPKIHYGLIASGNKVVKDARERDNLAKEYGILCFEMEAAGIMNILPSFIIRGICDYADSHKNKKWQNYAAATAAAYTKLLLFHLRRDSESRSMSPALGSSRSMEGLDNGWASVRGESVEQEVGSGPVKRRRRI